MNNPIIKFILVLLLLILCVFSTGLFFPWWSMAVVSFLIAIFIPMKPWRYLLAGFFSACLFWGGMTYWISMKNDHILAHRISQLIIQEDNPTYLIMLTALMGAMVGGVSCWSGSLVRQLWTNLQKK